MKQMARLGVAEHARTVLGELLADYTDDESDVCLDNSSHAQNLLR